MRWSTHPLLSRHNTFTFRFLPGVLVGIAVSWWLNDRPRQVQSRRSTLRVPGHRSWCAESQPLLGKHLNESKAAQVEREAEDGAPEPPPQRQTATVVEEPEEELKMVLANCA